MHYAFRFFDLQHCLDEENRPLSECPKNNPYGVEFKDCTSRRLDNSGKPTIFNRSALDQAVAHRLAVEELITDISHWLERSHAWNVGSLGHAWQVCSLSRWFAFYVLEVEGGQEVSAPIAALYKVARGLHTALSHALLNHAAPSDALQPSRVLHLANAKGLLVRRGRSCAAPDALLVSMLTLLARPNVKPQNGSMNPTSLERIALYADLRESLEFAVSWLVAMSGHGASTTPDFVETTDATLSRRISLWGQHSPIGVFLSQTSALSQAEKEAALRWYGQIGIDGPMDESHAMQLVRKSLIFRNGRPDQDRSIGAFADALASDRVFAHG